VRAFAVETVTPAELCARVNRMISGHITVGRFITFFYAILDTQSRRLAYANAGHNPPLLRGADGQVRPLDRGGTVLGLFRDSPYEQEVIGLRPGDRLLFFTDGLSEAANAAEEEFGEERLAAQLGAIGAAGAEEVKTGLLKAVSDFCGGAFRDDATLIVIQVE
jgi:sigma-B regulation protein RsbU (phosphoserine phosphatase)